MELITDDENKHSRWIGWNQQSVEVKMLMDLNNLYEKKKFGCFFLLIVKVRYLAFVMPLEHVAFGWHMTLTRVVNNWDKQKMLIEFVMKNKHVCHFELNWDLSILKSPQQTSQYKEHQFTRMHLRYMR